MTRPSTTPLVDSSQPASLIAHTPARGHAGGTLCCKPDHGREGLHAICMKVAMAFVCLFLGVAGVVVFIATGLARWFRKSLWS